MKRIRASRCVKVSAVTFARRARREMRTRMGRRSARWTRGENAAFWFNHNVVKCALGAALRPRQTREAGSGKRRRALGSLAHGRETVGKRQEARQCGETGPRCWRCCPSHSFFFRAPLRRSHETEERGRKRHTTSLQKAEAGTRAPTRFRTSRSVRGVPPPGARLVLRGRTGPGSCPQRVQRIQVRWIPTVREPATAQRCAAPDSRRSAPPGSRRASRLGTQPGPPGAPGARAAWAVQPAAAPRLVAHTLGCARVE